MTISYLVTVCNELNEVSTLLNFLISRKREGDEVVALFDQSAGSGEVLELLSSLDIKLHKHSLNGDFSEFKNTGNSVCKSDWIFQIDADEKPSELLMESVHGIVEVSERAQGISIISIPRVNEVIGITDEHLVKWGWTWSSSDDIIVTRHLSELDSEYKEFLKNRNLIIGESLSSITYKIPMINYPDYQTRLYKNISEIKWIGRVHETVKHTVGNFSIGQIPQYRGLDLFHIKKIDRQEKQNNFYNKLV